jgi:hypothetical protein
VSGIGESFKKGLSEKQMMKTNYLRDLGIGLAMGLAGLAGCVQPKVIDSWKGQIQNVEGKFVDATYEMFEESSGKVKRRLKVGKEEFVSSECVERGHVLDRVNLGKRNVYSRNTFERGLIEYGELACPLILLGTGITHMLVQELKLSEPIPMYTEDPSKISVLGLEAREKRYLEEIADQRKGN